MRALLIEIHKNSRENRAINDAMPAGASETWVEGDAMSAKGRETSRRVKKTVCKVSYISRPLGNECGTHLILRFYVFGAFCTFCLILRLAST
jgi:hypothetical protein